MMSADSARAGAFRADFRRTLDWVRPLLLGPQRALRVCPDQAARTHAVAVEVLATERLSVAQAVDVWARVLLSDKPVSVGLVGVAVAAVPTRVDATAGENVLRDLCCLVPGAGSFPGDPLQVAAAFEEAILTTAREQFGAALVDQIMGDLQPRRAGLARERVDEVVRMLDGSLSADALCVCASAYLVLGDVARMTVTVARALQAAPGHRLAGLMFQTGVLALDGPQALLDAHLGGTR